MDWVEEWLQRIKAKEELGFMVCLFVCCIRKAFGILWKTCLHTYLMF